MDQVGAEENLGAGYGLLGERTKTQLLGTVDMWTKWVLVDSRPLAIPLAEETAGVKEVCASSGCPLNCPAAHLGLGTRVPAWLCTPRSVSAMRTRQLLAAHPAACIS